MGSGSSREASRDASPKLSTANSRRSSRRESPASISARLPPDPDCYIEALHADQRGFDDWRADCTRFGPSAAHGDQLVSEVSRWPCKPFAPPFGCARYLTDEVMAFLVSTLRGGDDADPSEQEQALWAIRNLLEAEGLQGDGRDARLKMVAAGALEMLRDLLRHEEAYDMRILISEVLDCLSTVLTPRSRRAILGRKSSSPCSSLGNNSRDSSPWSRGSRETSPTQVRNSRRPSAESVSPPLISGDVRRGQALLVAAHSEG
eukprot:1051752-Prymnesium_polylepis.1